MALPKVGVEAVIEGMAAFEADSKKINKSLDDIGTGTSKLGSIASGVTSKITSLAGSLLKIGTIGVGVAIAGIGAGLYEAATAGLSFNNAMEQAGAKINAFTKDADLTAKILEDVRVEASKTPFEFEAMANAVSGLLPAARQADVGIMELLQDAEVLAASNPAEGLEGAAFALREAVSGDFTSVIERFNLPRQMINQLKAEGLPALEIVRQAMNNMGYDMDLVSALANTAEGRWSTFKDTLTNLAGTITQPIFQALSQGLADVNSFLTANEPLLTQMAVILAGQISEALTLVAQKATELFTAFQQGGASGIASALGLGDLITMWTTVQPILAQLFAWLNTNIPTAIQTVSDLWNNNLLPGFTQIADAISSQLLPALSQLSGVFLANVGTSQTFAQLWQSTLLPALMAVGNFVLNTLFPAWVQMQVFMVGSLAVAITALAGYWQNYLFPAISMVSNFVTTTVIPALTMLWEWLGPKLGVSIQNQANLWNNTLQPALLAINSFISQNIVPLLISLANLFNATLNKAIQATVGLWRNALLPALQAVGDFLSSNLMPAFASIGEVVSDDVSPVLTDLGEKVMPLLQEGLDYVTEAIKEVIGYFDSLKDSVESFVLPDILTPGSPPPLAIAMMDIAKSTDKASQAMSNMIQSVSASSTLGKFAQIGQNIIQGIASGVGSGGTIKEAILGQIDFAARWFEKKGSLEDEERAQAKQALFNAFEATFGGITQGTMGGSDFLAAFRQSLGGFDSTEVADAMGVASDHINEIISTIKSQFGPLTIALKAQAVSIASNFASLGSSFADAMQPGIEARQDIIDRIQEFLKSGEDQFEFDYKPHLVEGVDSVMMDRIKAQQHLNLLLQDQRKEQEEINRLQQQQKQLEFLQQQISLMQLIESRGLNPRDILGGITLGVEASAADLLSVTGNIVNAMVNQINRDLQISSPSKVMMGIGQQMMAGLQRGIVSMTPVLNAQLSASVAGPLSPMMAGAMNSSNVSTTNNFNVGGNTISSGMGMAEFEARVLQVIRRNL